MSGDFVIEATDLGSPVKIPRTFGRYTFHSMLGTGSSSVVCLVCESRTKQFFAAKVVDRESLIKEGRLEYFERELRIMSTMQHPNILNLLDVFYLQDVIIMILDYCSNGDLLTYIYQHGTLGLPTIRSMLHQFVTALDYLHSRGIAHRDLKPENILIDENNNVKLADFGLTKEKQTGKMMQTMCGTMYYTAPEVLLHRQYDGRKADIWSVGVITSLLVHGSLPWRSEDDVGILRDICSADVTLAEDLPEMIHSFIMACLQLNPNKRATTQDLLKTQLLAEVAKPPRSVKLTQVTEQPRGSQPRIGKPNQSIRKIYVRPIRTVQSQRLAPGRFFITDVAKQRKAGQAIGITPSLRLPK